MIVPDVLQPGLALVLCGTAPSRASKEARAYYAHPGNIFWQTLHQVGLTPRLLAPHEYPLMPTFGIGLTDLNKTEWGADAELSHDGFDVASFTAKMLRHRPGLIAFDSKFAACKFFGRRTVAYGLQPETMDGIPLFVAPSTSGRARMYFDIGPWTVLGTLVGEWRRRHA
ncbi:MAG TPA: mismatch-specific DNA-glycosylase [Candidatus Omnitrophota bacterium]|nr:mismatch-specific DNA-glycosylase [Candidatus Omnitrophota bacterium]